MSPVHEVNKVKNPFPWTKGADKAFEKIKKRLSSLPFMYTYTYSKTLRSVNLSCRLLSPFLGVAMARTAFSYFFLEQWAVVLRLEFSSIMLACSTITYKQLTKFLFLFFASNYRLDTSQVFFWK